MRVFSCLIIINLLYLTLFVVIFVLFVANNSPIDSFTLNSSPTTYLHTQIDVKPKNKNVNKNNESSSSNVNIQKANQTFIKFQQSTFHNSFIDLRNFNYNGVCKDVYKYTANNERDLWLTSYAYENYKSFLNANVTTPFVLDLLNSSIPHATKVFLLLSDPPYNTFASEMKTKYNISVIQFDVTLDNKTNKGNAATRRMLAWKEWLAPRRHLYDRVFISDLRDIYVFGDLFATFSTDDLVLQMECLDTKNKCTKFLNGTFNYKWMIKSFDLKTAIDFSKNGSIVSNVGATFGGTEKIYEYLTVMANNINMTKWDVWGYDQCLHNSVIYSRQLDYLNPTLENAHKECALWREKRYI
ncbi:hypothetical protein EIN_324180, partial [Entamoeba invadens IP1]